MSTSAALSVCSQCEAQLIAGLLACPGCARLVHSEQLAQLASLAEQEERAGDLTAALTAWRNALELLPASTRQRGVIEARMQKLSATLDGRAPGTSASGKHAGKLAGLGVVGLVLLKSKTLLTLLLANAKLLLVGLTKLPTLLSMLLYARWSAGNGVAFGVGLVASLYAHEVGHVAALRRYGIAASAPMFVPGLGAFVRLKQYPTDAHEEARTGLAGPLWGLWAACAAFAIGKLFGLATALQVAAWGATLNMFNLLPVWQLDGARGYKALARVERIVLGVYAIALGLLFRQWMPGLVGAVALARSWSRSDVGPGDRRVLMLFAALLLAHALIAHYGH